MNEGNTFKDYQDAVRKLDIYPEGKKLECHIIGIGNEAGEVLGKLKKQIRDKQGEFNDPQFKEDIKKELGDVLWYLANTAEDLGLNLGDIAQANLDKLLDRQKRGVLGGSGDNR